MGLLLGPFQSKLSGGSIFSDSDRFELQLDRLATEGFFIYDHQLGRVVRSYTEELFSSLLITTIGTLNGMRVSFLTE